MLNWGYNRILSQSTTKYCKVLCLLALLLLGACGQKGVLYLPEKPMTEQDKNAEASVEVTKNRTSKKTDAPKN